MIKSQARINDLAVSGDLINATAMQRTDQSVWTRVANVVWGPVGGRSHMLLTMRICVIIRDEMGATR